ncbi:MAG: Smr/MutS family protein [Candidatus Solibacter usitatus]|nr:Smr/MutS family protein [Candidatus Solibacter usitatus]
MTHTSADLLEFEALRLLVGRYVGSPMGRDLLQQAAPLKDRAAIEQLHRDTAEAMDYLRTAAQPKLAARGSVLRLRFTDLPDCSAAVQKVRIEGAVLDGKEIFDVLGLLDRAADVRSVLDGMGSTFPLLTAKARGFGDFRPLLRELAGRIEPDGSVSDHASVALHRIRRGIEKQKQQIQESLERFMKAHRADGVLQEDFVTLRNDRFVVPIVAGQQARVQGVIHGSSGSGHSLFVEPLETIDRNNELVRMVEEELREVHRILREMSARLRTEAPAIALARTLLGEFDWIFAKASFALEFQCVIPRFSPEDKPVLRLEAARHPLLEDVLRRQGKTVIPISFVLDKETRTLLLSGPNTGGKTVTLKTAGLLALMAQSGIPVPAREAEFPLFDQVLADLGDNQSIAESLSSFSSHIRRMNEILRLVTPDSLVLLDELGRATDPEEGGALGIAILENLRSWKAFTLASTHLLALKVFAGSRDGVLNGSMGFNRETLAPTYLLRLGAPGESAGLSIAGSLGMPPDLIARARAAMSNRERDLADYLTQLQTRTAELAEETEQLREQRKSLEAREASLAKEWERKESGRIKEIERRAEEIARKFEEESRKTIDSILQGAANRKSADQARTKTAKTIREFKEEFQAAVRAGTDAPPPLQVQEGARVRLKNVREPAKVRRILGPGRYEVEAGFLKMQVQAEDVVEVLPASDEGSRLPANVTFKPAGPAWDVSFQEINVIGKRVEEALDELDKFLDHAAMASVQRIRIVHGHGMGVLKRAVAEFLSKNPHVARFLPATQSEGGAGATIVEMREN